MDGYGVSPYVNISHNSTPYDHLDVTVVHFTVSQCHNVHNEPTTPCSSVMMALVILVFCSFKSSFSSRNYQLFYLLLSSDPALIANKTHLTNVYIISNF